MKHMIHLKMIVGSLDPDQAHICTDAIFKSASTQAVFHCLLNIEKRLFYSFAFLSD